MFTSMMESLSSLFIDKAKQQDEAELNSKNEQEPQYISNMSMPVEVAGTSFWIPITELIQKDVTNEQWLDRVRTRCESEDFQSFCEHGGMTTPTFEWKHPSAPVLNRFVQACRSLSSSSSSSDGNLCVSAVFHGTATNNIKNILSKGLDPKKRKGQAYGPGEYFGKDPGTATSYCRGGKQMCVFLVVVPKEKATQQADTGVQTYIRRSSMKPFEMVIVENNDHQLPIGVLKFSAVDSKALNASYELKRQLQALNKEAVEAETQAKLAANKAKIIQFIIHRELELAASLYNRIKSELSYPSKKEIGIYAHEAYDEEFISFYFDGGLPKPNQGHANEEFASSQPRTVEELEKDWKDATVKLDTASKATSPGIQAWWEQEQKSRRLGGADQSRSHWTGGAWSSFKESYEKSKNANDE